MARKEVIQTVTLDLTKNLPAPIVFCKQADNVVRILHANVLDNGEVYTIPADVAARLRGTKADGKYIYLDARAQGDNWAEFVLTQNALAAFGKATCEVELSDAEGGIVKTCNLTLNVQETALNDEAVESTDEWLSLQAAAAAAKAAQAAAEKSAEDAADSAGAAAVSETNAETSKLAAAKSADAAAASAGAAADSKSAAKESETAAGGSATAAANSATAAEKAAKEAQQVSQGAVGWYATLRALTESHPTAKDGNWAILGTTDTIWVWDSDTEAWKDTGEKTDLSNYYPKKEIDAMLAAIRTKVLTVTAPAAGWVSGSYAVAWDDGTSTTYAYRNRVTVAGVTADSRLAVSQHTQPTNAVCQVAALEAGAGVVDFYADSAVSADAVFVVEVTAG